MRKLNIGFVAATRFFGGSQCLFDMPKAIFKTNSLRLLQVVRGHQKVKHWISCCYCIPGVPNFYLIYIKPQLKHFYFGGNFRSLEVIIGHQKVKHWIRCCYCFPGVLSYLLIYINPQLKHFYFGGHFRSLEVIRGHQRSLER